MNNNIKAFTLVELVITISIIAILSTISTVIFRNYTLEAKKAEGYTLIAKIRDAQLSYCSEYGNFLSANADTSFQPVLNINSMTNKYFTKFNAGYGVNDYAFTVRVASTKVGALTCTYDITVGSTIK
ncbi:MAG: prepilin-type N-terminal cleavage/methylation domain-containing protein [Elusimicrobia bacterium]|nr:prepilin-type N-terminal cleavage/methylation domain-containing protein [Elusimicrobiota bacterium]